jgi:hypothetical protein
MHNIKAHIRIRWVSVQRNVLKKALKTVDVADLATARRRSRSTTAVAHLPPAAGILQNVRHRNV